MVDSNVGQYHPTFSNAFSDKYLHGKGMGKFNKNINYNVSIFEGINFSNKWWGIVNAHALYIKIKKKINKLVGSNKIKL